MGVGGTAHAENGARRVATLSVADKYSGYFICLWHMRMSRPLRAYICGSR